MTSPTDSLLALVRIGLGRDGTVPEVSDWDAVHDLAVMQGVNAIAFDGYKRMYDSGTPVPEMPVVSKKKWIASSYFYDVSAQTQKDRASRVGQILSEGQIRTYILKGAVIAECYPVPDHRYSADMDCFLLPAVGQCFDAWERGNSLIEEKGYRVARSFYKNSSFLLPGLKVENHVYFTPFRGNGRLKKLERQLQGMIRADDGSDKFEGVALYRPPVMVSALFLIEHAYSHFLHEGLTLRHIIDWNMFGNLHKTEIDWPTFLGYMDEFGLRRFYDAYVHVGEYIMGDRAYSTMTAPEQRMMNSVWDGLDLHDTLKGFRGKMNLVGNTLRAGWKYRYFSPISMTHALWIQVKGVLFDKHPRLD